MELELIESDLRITKEMFAVLKEAAGIEGVYTVEITFTNECGDKITVGYGQHAEPAIIKIVVNYD